MYRIKQNADKQKYRQQWSWRGREISCRLRGERLIFGWRLS